jgi:undecaprenyl-diphosphatase
MHEMRELPLHHAVVLGLLHGPTELLPISSSAHTSLVPWLLGWRYGELHPQLRKSFEVALHAGTAAALLLRSPWGNGPCGSGGNSTRAPELGGPSPSRVAARLRFLVGALAPPALMGYALGDQIERRLGTPASIAAGLLAGSAAIGAGEIYAKKGCPTRARGARLFGTPIHQPPHTDAHRLHDTGTRPAAGADLRDGLTLGLAQSLALVPGVSRSGATFAAARARGFSHTDADLLSWKVGLPVIAGAAALKGARLASERTSRGLGLPLAAGAASAFLSTLASTRVLTPQRRTRLVPACTAYRAGLALLVIRRMRDKPASTPPIPKK